jgi:hypothetical protein
MHIYITLYYIALYEFLIDYIETLFVNLHDNDLMIRQIFIYCSKYII